MAEKRVKMEVEGVVSVEDAPEWDLSDLYGGITDPKIERDMQAVAAKAQEFRKAYRRAVAGLSVAGLAEALQKFEEVHQGVDEIEVYAHLVFSVRNHDQEVQAFYQNIKGQSVAVRRGLLFFELELLELSDKQLKSFLEEEELRHWRHFLHKLSVERPHRLTEAEERIFHDKSLTGRSAFERLFEQEQARQMYEIKIEGEKRILLQEDALQLLRHEDRQIRLAAADGVSRTLQENVARSAFILNMVMEDKAIDDRYRGFERPESSRHLTNEISAETVEAMMTAVRGSYDLVAEYYDFKRKVLGYEELYEYDRYAPITQEESHVSFSTAQTIVLEAFGRFSPMYRDVAQKFFDEQWIDAKVRSGKRGGAYCMYVTPEKHPYVFLNYTADLDSVSTLAHELGHGVHAYLAREQSYLHYNWPLTVAETASVFGEMLLFDALKEQVKDEKKLLGLVMGKIEHTFATIHRQTAMFLFERDVHAARQEEGELSAERISEFWQRRQQEMFGDSLQLREEHALWWSYIPHIVRSPFYVYAYAFGELLTLSLYTHYQRHPEGFAEKYLQLLSSGGSQSPDELVRPMGIDLQDPHFWEEGVEVIRDLVTEAKRLDRL